MNRKSILGLAVLVFAVSYLRGQSTETKAIKNDDINVISFEELQYPRHGSTEAEGVVVVRVGLDKRGQVLEANALSGKETFISDVLSNAKKWRFRPNEAKTAIIVYNFRLTGGTCKIASSFFTFKRPNLVTITGCFPSSTTQSPVEMESSRPMVPDQDIEVLGYEDLKYPALAAQARISGTVVVQAKLDDEGHVATVEAISGHPVLIRDCLAAVKNWHFRPNREHLVTVVFSFRFPCEGTLYKSESQRQFVLYPPNFALVSAVPMTVQTSR